MNAVSGFRYRRAVALVSRRRNASTNHLARHLEVSFNEAPLLMEQMERDGIVSEVNEHGARRCIAAAND